MRVIDKDKLYRWWVHYLGMLQIRLFAFQSEMADGLLQLPEYADCTQTRQSGKSFVMGVIIYFLAFYLKWHIIIVAPRLDQTGRIMDIVQAIATYMKTRKGIKHPTFNASKIAIENRGTIICITGDPFAQVEGHKAHLIVMDEKQELVKDHIAGKILPFRGFFNGLVWSLGIGGTPDSWGEESRKKAAEGDNFLWNCPWERVVVDKPSYQRVVDDQRSMMLPILFAAHYCCEELDMSSHLILPSIKSYSALPKHDKAITTVAFDFGAIDKTIATVSHKIGETYYWDQWIALHGNWSQQIDEVARWLKEDIYYDHLYGEANGVGAPVISQLNKEGLGMAGIDVNQTMKNVLARKVVELSSLGKLQYNKEHELASVFHHDITRLTYKMTSMDNIKVDHSDFYSSGILTLMDRPKIRIAA